MLIIAAIRPNNSVALGRLQRTVGGLLRATPRENAIDWQSRQIVAPVDFEVRVVLTAYIPNIESRRNVRCEGESKRPLSVHAEYVP